MTDKQKITIFNVFLFIVSVAIIFLPAQKYYYLQSTFFDLGLYSHIVSNLNIDVSLLYHGHFQPILVLPSVIVSHLGSEYAPYVLLLIQSLILIISGLIIQRTYGRKISAIYFISPLLWSYLLFDFHVECFLVFFLVLYYKELNDSNFVRAAITTLFFSLVKEVYILLAIALVFQIIFISFLKKISAIRVYFLVCVLFFNLFLLNFVFYYILPLDSSYAGAYLNGSQYSWLGYGFLNKIFFIFTHPFDIVNHVLTVHNIIYLLFLIAATGFFSIFSLSNFLPFISILAIYFLPKNSYYANFTGHYNIVFLVPLLVCLYNAVRSFPVHNSNRLYRICFLLFSYLVPGAITSIFFVYVYLIPTHFYIDQDHLSNKKYIIDKYTCANLAFSIQNNINYNCSYSAMRPLIFPEGVYNLNIGSNINYTAKYIIIDTSIIPFVYDKSCGKRVSSCVGSAIAKQYNQIRSDLLVHSKLIEVYNGLEVYEQY